MKNLIFILGIMWTNIATAQVAPPTVKNLADYSAVVCRIEDGSESPLAIFSEQLMKVKMDDHWGLFKQMRLQVGLDQLQVQVLLEEDFARSRPGAINVLVNFSVNGNETSQEFAGQNITYASVKHMKYKAHCELH